MFGPSISGLLGTFPIFAAILAGFAQTTKGEHAARQVLYGMTTGLVGPVVFYAILGVSIEDTGITWAFLAAIAGALFVQGIALLILRGQQQRRERRAPHL